MGFSSNFRRPKHNQKYTAQTFHVFFPRVTQENAWRKGTKENHPTKTSMTWGITKVSGSCLGSQCGFTTNAGSGDTGTQGTAMERKVMTGKLGERNCSMLEP